MTEAVEERQPMFVQLEAISQKKKKKLHLTLFYALSSASRPDPVSDTHCHASLEFLQLSNRPRKTWAGGGVVGVRRDDEVLTEAAAFAAAAADPSSL